MDVKQTWFCSLCFKILWSPDLLIIKQKTYFLRHVRDKALCMPNLSFALFEYAIISCYIYFPVSLVVCVELLFEFVLSNIIEHAWLSLFSLYLALWWILLYPVWESLSCDCWPGVVDDLYTNVCFNARIRGHLPVCVHYGWRVMYPCLSRCLNLAIRSFSHLLVIHQLMLNQLIPTIHTFLALDDSVKW